MPTSFLKVLSLCLFVPKTNVDSFSREQSSKIKWSVLIVLLTFSTGLSFYTQDTTAYW